jgi:hypothetical protein
VFDMIREEAVDRIGLMARQLREPRN